MAIDLGTRFTEAGRAAAVAAGLDPSTIPARTDCFEVVRDVKGLKVRGWKVRYRTILRGDDGELLYDRGNLALSGWLTAPLPRGWEPPTGG